MVDIWSIGVLIYELLSGKSPFAPKDASKLKDIERATQQNILALKYDFPKEFPALAKDLVGKILKKNPKTRLNLSEIKTHPWVKINTQDNKPKKELNPEELIKQVMFAHTMAEKNKFAQVDPKLGEAIDPAFSHEEIIEIVRPDSMLDQNMPEKGPEVSEHIEQQVSNFKLQIEKIQDRSRSPTPNKGGTPNNKTLTPTSTSSKSPLSNKSTSPYTFSDSLSTPPVKSDKSPSSNTSSPNVTTLEIQLRLKTEECNYYRQEYEKLRAEKTNFANPDQRLQTLEKENSMLKAEIHELQKKLGEKEAQITLFEKERNSLEQQINHLSEKVMSTITNSAENGHDISKIESLEAQIKELQETRNREKLYYESKIAQFEAVIQHLQKGNNNSNSKAKVEELEELVKNLTRQVAEYSKILKAQYKEDVSGDSQKQKWMDDVRALQALSCIKQERIEKLERKLRAISSAVNTTLHLS